MKSSCCIDYNTPTITLASATLYGGLTASASNPANSSLVIAINNPDADTYISSLYLASYLGHSNITSITSWQNTRNSNNQIDFSVRSFANALPSHRVTTFTVYPRTAIPINITIGETCNYVIYFANGQTFSGALIAQ